MNFCRKFTDLDKKWISLLPVFYKGTYQYEYSAEYSVQFGAESQPRSIVTSATWGAGLADDDLGPLDESSEASSDTPSSP